MRRIDKKIFEKLVEPAKLSDFAGEYDKTKPRKPNSKVRRHSGRHEVYVDDEEYPIQFVYYDDWDNYRDGFRAGWDINFLENKKKKKILAKKKKFTRKMKKLTLKTE